MTDETKKEECPICAMIERFNNYNTDPDVGQACPTCPSEESPEQKKLKELLAMDDEEFIKAMLEMSPEELAIFGKALNLEDSKKLEKKLMDTTANKIQDNIKAIEKEHEKLSDIKPFDGFCGENNPYPYGSVEYFTQEWVGSSETWDHAFRQAESGKKDRSVPSQYHDNMTAAEHYIYAQAATLSRKGDVGHDPLIEGLFNVGGAGFPLYSAFKYLGFFKNASPASWNQAYWQERGWTDSILSYMLPDKTGIATLGQCILTSDYYKSKEDK